MTRKSPEKPSVTLPQLIVPRSEAQQKLNAHIEKGRTLANRIITSDDEMKKADAEGDKWRDYAIRLLSTLFDTPTLADEYRDDTRQIMASGGIHFTKEREFFKDRMNNWWIKNMESIVESLDLIQENTIRIKQINTQITRDTRTEALEKIELIAKQFHTTTKQLKQRHNNRATLKIEDEYDVQDLFHALLRLFFDDIRDEEWTPSYAGGHSRIDFLLKSEQIVIELKMTRAGLKAKEVGDQLIIDIDRYRKAHPDCQMIVAFVYDPDGHIINPTGLENDLSRENDGMQVKVIINPH